MTNNMHYHAECGNEQALYSKTKQVNELGKDSLQNLEVLDNAS